jgi:hypothetical protein
VARTSANITDRARERWLLRKRDSNIELPKYEPKREKKPGSLELILGKWVEVRDDC